MYIEIIILFKVLGVLLHKWISDFHVSYSTYNYILICQTTLMYGYNNLVVLLYLTSGKLQEIMGHNAKKCNV